MEMIVREILHGQALGNHKALGLVAVGVVVVVDALQRRSAVPPEPTFLRKTVTLIIQPFYGINPAPASVFSHCSAG
jgi:hypothetical protein